MAFSESTPTYIDCSSTVGSVTGSHTMGASDKYVVVALYGSDNFSSLASSVTIDGVALTRITQADESYAGQGKSAELWLLLTGVPTGGTYTVDITMLASLSCRASVMSGGCGGIPVLADSDAYEVGPNGSYTFTMDSGAVHGQMFGVVSSQQPEVAGSTKGDLAVVHRLSDYAGSLSQAASTTGSRGFSVGFALVIASGALMLVESEPVVAPDAFGTEVGFTAGAAIGLTGPQYILGARIRAVEVGFREGLRMGGTAKRQVALVGPDDAPRLFTPEMTTAGNEGDILTQHADSPPTWEAKTHYEPVRFDTDGDGVADDWLFHTDGDVVMLEVEN